MVRGPKTKRAALYLRVSTGEQTTGNQRMALEAVAEQRGWTISDLYRTRHQRRQGKRPAAGARPDKGCDARSLRRVWCGIGPPWAILADLRDTLRELEGVGVDLVLHQQAIDTTTPAGRMFFQVTGAFAEFERETIRSRVPLALPGPRRRASASVARRWQRRRGQDRRAATRRGWHPEGGADPGRGLRDCPAGEAGGVSGGGIGRFSTARASRVVSRGLRYWSVTLTYLWEITRGRNVEPFEAGLGRGGSRRPPRLCPYGAALAAFLCPVSSLKGALVVSYGPFSSPNLVP